MLMRKTALLFVVPLALVILSLFAETSTAQVNSAHSSSGTSSVAASAAPTTLPISTVPSRTPSGSSSSPTATGDILMIKLYVGNIPRAEKFYGALFGAKPAVKIGKGAEIVTFPKGPGLALLQKRPADKNKVGGFIIQVPSLSATRALAVANGAKVQGKYAGSPASQAAQSIDLLDPWGNNVEILQLG
jgi:predicted enzyme related to lactoylglutathione lyase